MSVREKLYLIFHCSATPEGMDISPEWLMNLFKIDFGWSKPGYRTFADRDGVSHDLIEFDHDDDLEWSEVTYGARGFNTKAIHVCYAGGVSKHNIKIPKDTRTAGQKRALRGYLETYLSYYPDIKIGGHHMFNPHKACPSFDVLKWCNKIGVPEKNVITDLVYPDSVIKMIPDDGMFDVHHSIIKKHVQAA